MNIIFGIVRTKVFAVTLGVSGMGLISQFTNFISLLNFVIPLGLPMSMTKYVAEKEKSDLNSAKKAFDNSIKIVLLTSVISAVILILFSSQISELIINDSSYKNFIIIIALFSPFSYLASLLEAYVRGLKDINLLTKLLIISSVISIVITIPFVIYFNILGAIIAISGSPLIILAVYIYTIKKEKIFFWFSFKDFFDFRESKDLFKLGFASLIIGAINQITYLVIRIITIEHIGMEANGIYQSVLAISLNYFSFLFVFLTNYSLPKLNEIKEDSKFYEEINATFRIFLLLLTPLVSIIIVVRVLLVNILFSSDFSESCSLYKYQFTGDFFKALAWAAGLWLIPRNKIMLWIVLEIISFSIFPLLYLMLLNMYDPNIEFAAVSYLIFNLIHFILNVVFIKRYTNFSFTGNNISLFILSLISIILIILASEWNINLGYILLLPVLIIWYSLSSTKTEKEFIKKILFKRN